ncbi:MAG: hypothetical protein AB3N28_05375 [Kordiimonas sp.]
MHWNFEETKPDRLLMGTAFDVALFFLAVVLVVLIAVMPSNDLASGAAPGESIFWNSFYLSGPVALLWIGVFLRRRKRLHKAHGSSVLPEELSAIYSLINGLIVIMIGGWVVYSALNARLDSGAQQTHYAQVLQKEVEEEGRFESYQLFLTDWRHEGETLVLQVSSDLFDKVSPVETCLRLVIQPGAFGHEWIVENEPYQRSTLARNPGSEYQCREIWQQKNRLADSSISLSGRY